MCIPLLTDSRESAALLDVEYRGHGRHKPAYPGSATDLVKHDPYGTLVPEGEYRAVFLRVEPGRVYGKKKQFAHFRITEEGPHFGRELVRYYNAVDGPFTPRSHNLARDYMSAFGRRPPRKLSPKVFEGREFVVDVVTVSAWNKGGKRVPMPKDCRYSKVDRILRMTAGAAPR